MKRLGIVQRDKKLTFFYLFAIVSCTLWMGIGIVFTVYSGNLSRQEISDYVQTATEQTTYAVDTHIQDEFDALDAAAVAIHARWNTSERDITFERLVLTLMDYGTYVRVGVAGPDGWSLVSDRQGQVSETDVSEELFFQRALAGNNALSEPVELEEDGISVLYYAVPIYHENQIVGVLYAGDPVDEIRNIIENSLYAGRGVAHIINSEGSYIVKSNSPLSLGIGTNIFEIKAPLPQDVEQHVRGDLMAGRAGHFEYYLSNDSRYVAYNPMAQNGWFVFYAVPEYLVSARLSSIIQVTVVILVVAAAVFILYILLVWRITSQRRKDLEQIAFVDPLTGQRNGRKFCLDAENLLKKKNRAAYTLWYYNIRGFKYINTLFGVPVGNKLLQYLANHLAAKTGEDEVFGRTHDDVFFILRKCNDESNGELKEHFIEDARYLADFPDLATAHFRAELGAGVYRIDREAPPETLQDMMNWAQEAHDDAAWRGGTRLGIYTAEMRMQKLWELEMEARQETALQNKEFEVYWQPKIAIQDRERIHGMESLVRWAYPGEGIVMPGQYIGLFEQNGFIVKLDLFVFEEACRQYAANRLWKGPQPLVMSVNVSRLSMIQPGFVETYIAVKNRYNIPPGCVELEFTESLAYKDHDQLAKIITTLHENGILCSLDDFGAGYSSLNILKSLRVDVLKLDREFFHFGGEVERGAKLVAGVISMAGAMGMSTIAEGVDEQATVEMLREMGCDMIQGYIYAKPMTPGEFLLFLLNWANSV